MAYIHRHTKGEWIIIGDLEDLTVENDQDRRIAAIKCYDNQIPNYD